jgi:deoxyribonuclease V
MLDKSLLSIPDLWKATYDLVSQVPEGMVTTYGHVAKALGDVVASRFVGLAMSMNEDIVRVPCRRVVLSDGRVGGYTGGGPSKKAALLSKEGIRIEDGKIVDLPDVLFDEFVSDYPLRRLRERQVRLSGRVRIPRANRQIDKVAGIDVAYSGEHAYSSLLVFDAETGEQIDRVVSEGHAEFPYVPTYLAFRELPIISPLIRHLDDRTVLMYDGNGLLHPHRFGIASHAGVVFDIPTIGIAKSLLCGRVLDEREDHVSPIVLDGRILGYRLSRGGSSAPVYVSVGHGMSARQAIQLVKRFLRHRIPEPTRLAHIEATRVRLATSHK